MSTRLPLMLRLVCGAVATTFVVGLFWPQLLPFHLLDPYLWVFETRVFQAISHVLFFGLAVWAFLKGTRVRYLPHKLIFTSVGIAWVLWQAVQAMPRPQPETAIVYYRPLEMTLGWVFTLAVLLAMLIDGLEYRRKRLRV